MPEVQCQNYLYFDLKLIENDISGTGNFEDAAAICKADSYTTIAQNPHQMDVRTALTFCS